MTHEATPRPSANDCNAPQRTVAAGSWASIRAGLGLSLRQMEHHTGINRGDLSKIERGVSCPTPNQAERILNVR